MGRYRNELCEKQKQNTYVIGCHRDLRFDNLQDNKGSIDSSTVCAYQGFDENDWSSPFSVSAGQVILGAAGGMRMARIPQAGDWEETGLHAHLDVDTVCP
jgi:hypothetical protein